MKFFHFVIITRHLSHILRGECMHTVCVLFSKAPCKNYKLFTETDKMCILLQQFPIMIGHHALQVVLYYCSLCFCVFTIKQKIEHCIAV